MYKTALIAGILFAGLAVMIGAFGAHGLKPLLSPEDLQVFDTGVKYQFYHSFALLVAGTLYASCPFKQVRSASVFFIIGILLFSGSLYAITLLKIKGQVGLGGVGILTPIGGLCFIIGWLLLLFAVIRKK